MLSSGSPQPGLWRVATTPMFSLSLRSGYLYNLGTQVREQKSRSLVALQ